MVLQMIYNTIHSVIKPEHVLRVMGVVLEKSKKILNKTTKKEVHRGVHKNNW